MSDWDPLAEDMLDAPDLVHTRLRASCPVAYSEAFGGFWTLTKYHDIDHAARDWSTFTSVPRFKVPSANLDAVRRMPLQADPPEHSQYRALLKPFFARRRVYSFEPRIRRLVLQLIGDSGRPAKADLCELITLPLSGAVLCMFLGFPEGDWDRLKTWTAEQNRAGREEDDQALSAVMKERREYIGALRADRLTRPLAVDDDLMSALLAAEIDGEPIDEEHLIGMFELLMNAGHETTSSGLGNLLWYLSDHIEDQDRLRADPALIPAAIEEMLRFWGPVAGLARTTTCDVHVRGRTIPAREPVVLMFASAGRDEDVHADAERWILDRQSPKHLAFGTGVHRCIGDHLARLQIRVATEELLHATTRFVRAGKPERTGWPSIGTSSLPVHAEWAPQD